MLGNQAILDHSNMVKMTTTNGQTFSEVSEAFNQYIRHLGRPKGHLVRL